MTHQHAWQSEKTRLYNGGYAETDKPCPDCGCFVWTPYDDTDTVTEERQECPCCGWGSVTYDG